VRRLLRNPDLLAGWNAGRLLVKDLSRQRDVLASPEVFALLDLFSKPRTPGEAADALPDFERRSVLRSVRRLARIGLLLPAPEARRRVSRLSAWKQNFASAQYHVACRDMRYVAGGEATERYLQQHVVPQRRPLRFKRYGAAARVRLPNTDPRGGVDGTLGKVLGARRTARNFARDSVALEDLAAVLRGTWGKAGVIDAGSLGMLTLKTSPSAGALHPIECYVLAWNVAGLAPGIYHYDVAGDELRRLARRDRAQVRRAAVRSASGQRWIGGAAFLCVMTAVFGRTLWKYQVESAYRVLWLEAGHLAQTFALLATARGLGSFGLDGLQDSFIEEQIGLDGVTEFPVYLCGAGRRAPRS
jgi:SagB-type dehydrogenase family enzyme